MFQISKLRLRALACAAALIAVFTMGSAQALPANGWVEVYYNSSGAKVGQWKLTCAGTIVHWGVKTAISYYAEYECPIDTH